MSISALPPELYLKIAFYTDRNSFGRWLCVCQASYAWNTYDELWKAQAHKILTHFPSMSMEGWKVWVQHPTPLQFDAGTIDWAQRKIYVHAMHPHAIKSLLLIIQGVVVCKTEISIHIKNKHGYSKQESEGDWDLSTYPDYLFFTPELTPEGQRFLKAHGLM